MLGIPASTLSATGYASSLTGAMQEMKRLVEESRPKGPLAGVDAIVMLRAHQAQLGRAAPPLPAGAMSPFPDRLMGIPVWVEDSERAAEARAGELMRQGKKVLLVIKGPGANPTGENPEAG